MIGKNMTMMVEKDYSAYCASLPKQIKAKVVDTTEEMLKNPESPGLHIEKIGNDGLYSARVDLDYRIIFAVPEGSDQFYMLYVGKHDDAYHFADKYKVELNPVIGAIQKVEKAPKVMKMDAVSNKKYSRLAALTDANMKDLGIPEGYWQQFREQVFKKAQLIGFKGLIPEESYDTLEFILDGSPVDEALEIWHALKAPVIPINKESKEPLFSKYTAEELMSIGIPSDNVEKIRNIKTEEELRIVAETMPLLAQQSLYALKAGESVEDIRKATFASANHNSHNYKRAIFSPLTLSEFAPIGSEEVLRAIMEYPSDKWRVFLHPTQTEIIQQDYNGPARIVGGAGTGKTVVIVHRAKRLAGGCVNKEKILVTTFGKTLKHDIDERIKKICTKDEISRIDVLTTDKLTLDLTRKLLERKLIFPEGKGLSSEDIWTQAMKNLGKPGAFSASFCVDEWRDVIQAHGIDNEQDYLGTRRAGRGKRLDKNVRSRFWVICQEYRKICEEKKVIDVDLAQNQLASILPRHPRVRIYKSVIVDECQDLRAPALRMFRALAGEPHPNDMYLSGDSRQRIYGGQVSLSQCGISINNRSRILKLNYRTTEEIYEFAAQFQRKYRYDDLDGEILSQDKSNCIFHGPKPFIRKFETLANEADAMVRAIKKLLSKAVLSTDICIMARTNKVVYGIRNTLETAGVKALVITPDQADDKKEEGIRVMTMHRGKGMEYSYVFLPGLRENAIPPKTDLMEKAGDEELLEGLMLSESNLLAVAITRAKRGVWLSYSGKPSILIKGCIEKS